MWRDLQATLVETMGLEPTTPCLQSRCSSQLSYVPVGATIVGGVWAAADPEALPSGGD